MFLKATSYLVPIKKNRVTLIRTHYSGSNVSPVYEELKKNKKIDVVLVDHDPYDLSKNLVTREASLLIKLLRSKVIVTTHGPLIKTKKNITIDLWHGAPLKAMNLMNKWVKDPKPIKGIDYLNSYSPFFNTVFNSCFGLTIKNYICLGTPRNDYLFSDIKRNLKEKLNIDADDKILFYLPTFRDTHSDNHESFITNLGISNFDLSEFDGFLRKNKLFFLIKPHPRENKIWRSAFKKKKLSRFKILDERDLIKEKWDLYEVLGSSDMLLTDYSSVYIDYLLLNKPIIFMPTDIEKYRNHRGFVLEPYDFWTPGPKATSQKDFEEEIVKSVNNKDHYEKERKVLCNIFHKNVDNKSSARVAKFIIKKITD